MNGVFKPKGRAWAMIRETPDPWTFLGPDGAFDLGDIDLPMDEIDLSGDWDCRDWVKEGVDWWRKEIAAYTKDCFKRA